MARIEVTVVAHRDDGQPIWSYVHGETVVPEKEAQDTALRMLQKIIHRVDEARATIIEQAGDDVPELPDEQAALEEDEALPPSGRGGMFRPRK